MDFINSDKELIHNTFGKFVYINVDGELNKYNTEELFKTRKIPNSEQLLSKDELNYIDFRYEAYQFAQEKKLDINTLKLFFDWYITRRKNESSVSELQNDISTRFVYQNVRYFLTITDCEEHFSNFRAEDSTDERYERDLATRALLKEPVIGKWVLRHSSRNRPSEPEELDRLQKCGIRYYALSFSHCSGNIYHTCLTHQVGKGWTNNDTVWYPCFLDLLETVLEKYGLMAHLWVKGYYKLY